MSAIALSAAIEAALKTLTGLVADEEKVKSRWVEFGQTCRNAFVTVQIFDQHSTQIRDAILNGLKKDAQKAYRAPKSDVKGMPAEEVKLRNRASSVISVYYGRVRNEYAFPPAPVAPVADPVRSAHEEAAKKAAQASIDKAAAVAAENAAKLEKKQLEESLKLTELLLKSAVERKDKAEATKTRKRVSDLKRKVQATESKVAEATTKTQEMIEAAKAAQLEANAKLALIEEQKARESLKAKLVDALKVARDSKLPNAPELVKALQTAHDLLVGAAK